MSGAIEALHIYDENDLAHANLLFLLTSSSEIEPLLALEFLHRVIDIFEEFLGAPLLSSKLESNYDVVAQLLNEVCDAGAVSTTEGNALRELVEVEGFLGKILGSINMPGKPGFSSSASSTAMPGISSLGASQAPALPWRRSNVRHTSNELYVDIVETLSVILAPSGRPLAAFANGTIAFTSKISGVPDLLLVLSSPSGKHNLESVMELPVFHPCVRLARWREHPGELSFIPPDGRFILAGYEVDLLPFTPGQVGKGSANLKLPVQIEMKSSLGPVGADFEVRVLLSKPVGSNNNSSLSSSRPIPGRGSSGFGGGGSSSSPVLEDLVITIPIPSEVRTLSEIHASRGDVTYNPGAINLEWHIPSKEASAGAATLRCTVVGLTQDDEEDSEGNGFSFDSSKDYNDHLDDESSTAYQSTAATGVRGSREKEPDKRDERKVAKNKILMPSSTRVSFSIQGWLPSGIRVESVAVDSRKSRGLGEGVKPYKGVKYLCVSRGGVELRC
ncbi:MAG: hypothetical protein M1818_004481 [Claussenomyces sp. TS43310]|nr:MAG: hypothetical protein M1818_004481 [Claussenomyces sp. TS43310]